ncbi:MAG: methylated-DNA--[protein]-cysteine S-methyltransferase [Gammaproteobacteria bacterium]|nr:methylated-DNA--[protein]-cysteine S-methyltransferase [Gammaproteobacteria bacterium]MDH3413531.1 methylated-DNA--[protein]-cysteine S-methyltransferase [Gammaproteobacteria bacterium]
MKRSSQSYDAVINAPFGLIGIRMRGEALAAVELRPRVTEILPPKTAASRKVATTLSRYFQNPAYLPSLDLELGGTPFQRRVWRALQRIPCGNTLTYGELARKLGTSARAIGGACRENPAPIVVPCHRVVAATGAGGFMGQSRGRALGIKSWLLCHEARIQGRD